MRAANALANVEYETLPAGVDGVLVRRPRERPLIIIAKTAHPKRQRFTLAHEIGHILIPWHLGSVGCSPEDDLPDTEVERVCEGEANRFASELLLPHDYVRQAIRGATAIREIYHRLIDADASIPAVTIALAEALPPGHVFAEAGPSGRVVLSGKSPGTAFPAPLFGARLNTKLYEKADHHETVLLGERLIHWWRFQSEAVLTLAEGDIPDSRTVLREILNRHFRGDAVKRALYAINGIIGAANSMYRAKSAGELLAVFRQRFMANPELDAVTRDPAFAVYLEAKAREIVARRNS